MGFTHPRLLQPWYSLVYTNPEFFESPHPEWFTHIVKLVHARRSSHIVTRRTGGTVHLILLYSNTQVLRHACSSTKHVVGISNVSRLRALDALPSLRRISKDLSGLPLAARNLSHKNRRKIKRFTQDLIDAIAPTPGITCFISEGVDRISPSVPRLLRFLKESTSPSAVSIIVKAGNDRELGSLPVVTMVVYFRIAAIW
jgi:hypothetical protein